MMFSESTCLRNAVKAARHSVLLSPIVLCVLIFLPGWLHAQSSAMSGLITDPSGAVVPHAQVTLTNERTHATWKVGSSNSGLYSVPLVPPGNYTIEVDAPGFKHYVQTGITIESAQALALDVHLQLSGSAQSVTVNGEANGYVATNSLAGTKTDTPLIETPQSLSVVTREQMNAQQAQSVPQALRYSAGVLAEWRGTDTDGLESVNARGFTMQEYLDGLLLPQGEYNVPSFEPFGLERVEILHGPASVLYGQASPGGLVVLASKQPKREAYHEVQFVAGSYGRYQGSIDFSGPFLNNRHLFYRLIGLARDTNTQVDHIEQQRYFIAPDITWQPSDNTVLTVLPSYQYDPKAGMYNFVPALGTVFNNPAGPISTSLDVGEPDFDKHSRRQYAIGYLFAHRFNPTWSFHQNFRYTHLVDKLDNVFSQGLGADNRSLTRYGFINHEYAYQTTLDNQALATLNYGPVKQTIIAGVDYQNIPSGEAYGFNFAVPTLDAYSPVYSQTIAYPSLTGDEALNQYQVGVYAHDQIRYRKWAFSLGGREDWAGTHDHEKISGTRQEQKDHAFTGRVGAVYLFDHGIAPYFSYSTSFQPDLGVDFSGRAFKPTTGQQYEAGVKYQPANFNGFITLAVFNLTEQNVATTDPAHPQFSIQTGELRSRGIELEGHTNLPNHLNLVASYSYLQNIVTKSNDTAAAYGINVGKTPYATPRNIASLWADYTIPGGLASGLNFAVGGRLVGRTFGNALNTFNVSSNALVDAAVHYDLKKLNSDLGRWQLSVNASNLADRRYVASCSSDTNCIFGLRRNVLGAVNFKW